MNNLLKETERILEANGKTPQDIEFIGSKRTGHSCTWGEFAVMATAEYHSGYGAQQVASDLEIVFSDGSFMNRWEYDGSEGWEYHNTFVYPEQFFPIKALFASDAGRVGWTTLEDIADEMEKDNE